MAGLGYLYPAIRLAHILQTHSHHVLFVSTREHGIILANYGIDHAPVLNNSNNNNRPFLDLHRWAIAENALYGFKALNDVVNRYRPDVIVTSPIALMSFIFAEKYKIPVINIGFCEYLFPCKSAQDDSKEWRINSFTEAYNLCREKMGLSVNEYTYADSPLIGTKYLLRSVSKLNEGLILPDRVECVGDLYFEPSYNNKLLSQFIASSKVAKRQIVYIQMGRLFKGAEVWENLLSVLCQLPMNFIVDTGRADYSVARIKMYNNFFSSSFIPIGAIRDDISFIICTAQTTSVVSAIIHGKQILAIPHSADSIELTQRLESNNLAVGIYKPTEINFDTIQDLFGKLSNCCLEPSIMEFKELFLSYTDEMVYEIVKSVS